ncbi:leucine-rich repeat domain-containing protein [Treponema phagedenis]|uniref:leucine-rich repeat domain-containing protein n=1 Tax=Treponema phagedenis TaxID=162 RepID=UPI0011E65AAC|nr:leucine-rich repeat protein [Treponema phagedenis]QEK01955.1 leucine-rich repeat protein [Treponema phagedenis]QEK07067.1 leucine-rich repeat protein [Treponema phagedenis]
MMKNSSIVKKGLMQIHKSLLVAVLAVAALGILGGLTACHEQPITPSGGSSGLTPSTPSKITVTVQGDANVKDVPFTLTATGKKWADIKTDAKAKITFNEGYELAEWKLGNASGSKIEDSHVFNENTTVFAVSKEKGHSAPSEVERFTATEGDSNVQLSWTNPSDADLKEVVISASPAAGSLATAQTIAAEKGKPGSYEVTGLTNGTEYIFTVKTKDKAGNISSGVIAKTTPAPILLNNFITDGNGKITGYNGEPPAILEIPEKIDEKPVVSIGEKAFTEKTSIQKVIFPKSLKTIENGTWNSNSKKPEGAFSDCTNLTELNFSKCTELTSIGRWAFSGCSSITGALTLPDSLTTIENGAFEGCSGITGELDLSHLTNLEYLSGFNETGITAVKFPANLKTIGRHAFFRCSGIRALTLPDSLTSIGWYAFSGCSGITALTLPSKLTSIGDFAFSGCSSIETLTLPEGLQTIEEKAFEGCKIETLEVGMKDISFTAEDVFGYSRTSITTLTLQEGVQTIGRSAFSGCSGIRALTLPDSLTSIGWYAFSGCSGITALTLPSKLTSIGDLAFSGCKIKTLEVGMKDISFTAEDVFGDSRTSITTLTLQEGVQTIGGYAFYGCINIGDIDLSKCNQLTTIDEKAFLGCKKATVKLPASITEIKEYAFGAKHAWWINPETNVGEYTESFCKEVQVPGNPGEADYDRISGLVKKNGIYASYSENYYPEDRIQPIPTP